MCDTLARGRDEGLGIEEAAKPDGAGPEAEGSGGGHRLGDALKLLHPLTEVVDPLNDGRVRRNLVQNPRLQQKEEHYGGGIAQR